MLEDLAIQFFSKSEELFRQIALGLVVIGAITAAIVVRSKIEISRAAYFAYLALIYFVVSATQTVFFLSLPAAKGGYFWVLLAISLLAFIAGGFFHCRISMARSRDAYGHARMAFLGFIPIAGFWLLLTPSKNKLSTNRVPTIPLFSGRLGVLTGFVLLAAGVGVTGHIVGQGRMIEQQARTDPVFQQTIIASMIRSKGLQETLHFMVANAQTPLTVDKVTTLARIEADGMQLKRTYLVDREGMKMTENIRSRIRDGICRWPAFDPILRAGGSIREIYFERNGREIGAEKVTLDKCGS